MADRRPIPAVNRPPPIYKKTDPSTNCVRLLGGVSFSAYCQRLTLLSRVSALPPRLLPFRKIRHTPLLFRLTIFRILPPFSGPRPVCCIFSRNRCSAILSENWLILFMIEVKQVVDLHGRSLLIVGYALTYRRDGESAGRRLKFFCTDNHWAYLPDGIAKCRKILKQLANFPFFTCVVTCYIEGRNYALGKLRSFAGMKLSCTRN